NPRFASAAIGRGYCPPMRTGDKDKVTAIRGSGAGAASKRLWAATRSIAALTADPSRRAAGLVCPRSGGSMALPRVEGAQLVGGPEADAHGRRAHGRAGRSVGLGCTGIHRDTNAMLGELDCDSGRRERTDQDRG